MPVMETLQSLTVLIVVIVVAFLAARLVMDAERRYLEISGATAWDSVEDLVADAEPEDHPRPQLRLVWSGPAVLADEPYDQMKDLAR